MTCGTFSGPTGIELEMCMRIKYVILHIYKEISIVQ
jgi:hypothetical protein